MNQKDFAENIGKIIRRYRRKRGYTLDNLSPMIDVSTATLSRYENGKIDISASTMAKISEVCDFSIEEYTREPYPEPPSEMFKSISGYKRMKAKLTAKEKKTEKDFNTYIEVDRPVKGEALRLAYQLDILAKADGSKELKNAVNSVKTYISEEKDKDMCDRLMAYMKLFSDMHKP